MRKNLRRLLPLFLICVMLLGNSISASAAVRWHNWGCGRCETVLVSCGGNGTYRVLSQQKGTIALYNSFKRRVTTTAQSYGSYRVTIVKVRDAYGRRVNQVVCRNWFWMTGTLNARLTKGTYQVTVRTIGYVPSAKQTMGPYIGKYWKCYPRWRIG